MPFITTPRQLNRFINTFSITYPPLKKEVNPADFLALTAFQVFCPDFYTILKNNMSLFCWTKDRSMTDIFKDRQKIKEEKAKQKQDLLESIIKDDNIRHIVEETLNLIFPEDVTYILNECRKQCRICHYEVFPAYFRLALEQGEISNEEIKTYIALSSDQKEFENILLRLADERNTVTNNTRFYHLLNRLGEFAANDIREQNINPIVRALYNVGDKCMRPEDENAGIMGLSRSDILVSIVIHQLTTRIKDINTRFGVIKKAMEDAESVYIVVHEIAMLAQQQGELGGREEREESFYITREHLSQLKAIAVRKIENAAENNCLFTVPHPISLLYRWKDWGSDIKKVVECVMAFTTPDESFITFLGYFAHNALVTNEQGSTEESKFNTQNLKDFYDLDNAVTRCRRIISDSPDWLTDDKRKVIQLFLQVMDSSNSQGLLNTIS